MNANDVNEQIRELEQLRSKTRRFRVLTMVALIAIVVAGVSAIYNAFYSLALAGPKQDVFVRNLNMNLQRDLVPVAERIASRSAQRLKPALEAELQRLNARAPEIAGAALTELNRMADELPVRAEKILDESVGAALEKREARLRKMHPGLYDRNIALLLDNINLEIQDQLAKSGEKIFTPHLDSIHSILADLEKIKKTESMDSRKDIDSWQVAFLFMDVFVHEFSDLSTIETAQYKATQP